MRDTREGVIENMPEREYHGGPELSSTAAKAIVHCPAEYHWNRTHPIVKDVFDTGALAHRLILGDGDSVHVVDAYDWRTKAAQQAKKDARTAGKRAVHRGDLLAASAMARSVRTTPDVADIFTRPGKAEVSLFATDPVTGVKLRGRCDWLTESSGRPCIVDVKTTATDTHPDSLAKAIASFGYHQQAAFYIDLLDQCGQPDAVFYFVFVPEVGPHPPRVVSLQPAALERGRELNSRAIETFATCSETGEWPCTHSTFLPPLDLPKWAYFDKEQPA